MRTIPIPPAATGVEIAAMVSPEKVPFIVILPFSKSLPVSFHRYLYYNKKTAFCKVYHIQKWLVFAHFPVVSKKKKRAENSARLILCCFVCLVVFRFPDQTILNQIRIVVNGIIQFKSKSTIHC